jgi:hypothetical protein
MVVFSFIEVDSFYRHINYFVFRGFMLFAPDTVWIHEHGVTALSVPIKTEKPPR